MITQVIRIIDQPAFHNLIQFCCPNLTEKDIPHWTKICKEIIEQAKVIETQVKKNLQVFNFEPYFQVFLS